MPPLRIAYEPLSMARWAGLFQVLHLERPDLLFEWDAVPFPTAERPLLDGADVGLFVEPPDEAGVSTLALDSSPMVVTMAVGHPLARREELSIADVLGEPFPGGPNHHPGWRSFWTLDEHRGGPPETIDEARDFATGLDLVASGRAIATLPAAVANELPHPGVIAILLSDGPQVTTRLVWRSQETNPGVLSLVSIATEMTGCRRK